jgi:hypothetical protein
MDIRFIMFDAILKMMSSNNHFLDNIFEVYNHLKVNILTDNTCVYTIKLFDNLKKIYTFCQTYSIDVLRNIDYKCDALNNIEKEYVRRNKTYIPTIQKFYWMFVNKLNDNINKIKTTKFYGDANYKLSECEIFYTLLIAFIFNCDEFQREYLGYIHKMIFNDHDFNLIRNAWALFVDDNGYNRLIRNHHKYVTTFDEDQFKYVEKLVYNKHYDEISDVMSTEQFEQNIETKNVIVGPIIEKYYNDHKNNIWFLQILEL